MFLRCHDALHIPFQFPSLVFPGWNESQTNDAHTNPIALAQHNTHFTFAWAPPPDREPCRVLSYDPVTWDFTIKFDATQKVKLVKRLSLVFAAENKRKLFERIERSKAIREETRVLCRYGAFINAQPSTIFAPIQQATVNRIMGKLLVSSKQLVKERQHLTDRLIAQVRDEYRYAHTPHAPRHRTSLLRLRAAPSFLPSLCCAALSVARDAFVIAGRSSCRVGFE